MKQILEDLAFLLFCLVVLSTIFSFFLSIAKADAVPVTVVVQEGSYGYSAAAGRQLVRQAASRFKGTGFRPKIRKLVKMDLSQCKQSNYSIFDYVNNARCFQNLAWNHKNRFGRPWWQIMILAPPAPDPSKPERFWFGGVVDNICSEAPRVAYATVGPASYLGLDYSRVSETIVTHELGHGLGASHYDDSYNIMHFIISLLYLREDPTLFPPWEAISIEEMKQCQSYHAWEEKTLRKGGFKLLKEKGLRPDDMCYQLWE